MVIHKIESMGKEKTDFTRGNYREKVRADADIRALLDSKLSRV